MPRAARRRAVSTTYTLSPPASPVPGRSRGEVWTLIIATRRTPSGCLDRSPRGWTVTTVHPFTSAYSGRRECALPAGGDRDPGDHQPEPAAAHGPLAHPHPRPPAAGRDRAAGGRRPRLRRLPG